MRVFVSSPAIDRAPAAELVGRLRMAGIEVESSPRGTDDPKFPDWYERGLAETLTRCDAFVVVLDAVWDSSTWMAIEADAMLNAAEGSSPIRPINFWNPDGLAASEVAVGMRRYLRSELPRGVDSAVAFLAAGSIE